MEDLVAELAEARRVNVLLVARVVELSALVESLTGQVAELNRRLGMDSRNSSKPPSSDDPSRGARKASSIRTKTGRKQGGQAGHAGAGLSMVAHPDVTERVEPDVCADASCGRELSDRPQVGVNVVQVFDVAPVTLTVTQLELVKRRCACGATTAAAAPFGVSGPTCYGPNVRAVTALISKVGHVSMERTAALMGMILSASVSTGFVAGVDARLRDLLGPFEGQVKTGLADADVAGMDETFVSLNGVQAYVFTFHDHGKIVWYGAHASRGHAALDGFAILDRFRGVLVRDDYVGYYKYTDRLRGVQNCCSHIIRALTGVFEAHPERQWWAKDLRHTIGAAITAANTAVAAGHHRLPPERIEQLRLEYLAGATAGIRQNHWTGRGDKPDGLILAERLIKKIDEFLYFPTDLRVPPTNNASERALRRTKTQQKISGCWRSIRGLEAFCRVHSYLTTAANHDVRPLDALRQAFTGNPWTLPTTA